MRKLLRSCLEKDPKRRLRDMGDIWRLLEDPPSETEWRGPAVREKLRAFTFLWLAISVLLAALGAVLDWSLKPSPPLAITRLAFTLPENQQLTTAIGRLLLTISPDGRNLVYSANQRLFLRAMQDPEAREISGSYFDTRNSFNPTPDGQELAFYTNADMTIKRIAVSGGAAVTVCQLEYAPTSMNWARTASFSREPGRSAQFLPTEALPRTW